MADLADLIRRSPTTEITTAIATAVSGRTVTMNLRGGTVAAPCLTSYAPAAGDIVALASLAAGSWLALGSLGTTSDAGPPAPPEATSGTLALNLTAWQVYADGAPEGRSVLAQGTDDDGTAYVSALYFGDAVRGSLTDLAATAARVWVQRTGDGPAAAEVYAFTHADTAPTSAAPDDSAAEAIGTLAPGAGAWLALTAAQVAALGSSAAGLAFGGPAAAYLTFASPVDNPQTGALRIDWEES